MICCFSSYFHLPTASSFCAIAPAFRNLLKRLRVVHKGLCFLPLPSLALPPDTLAIAQALHWVPRDAAALAPWWLSLLSLRRLCPCCFCCVVSPASLPQSNCLSSTSETQLCLLPLAFSSPGGPGQLPFHGLLCTPQPLPAHWRAHAPPASSDSQDFPALRQPALLGARSLRRAHIY